MNIYKIKKSQVEEKTLIFSLIISLLSPLISTILGIFRPDTALSFLYVILGVVSWFKVKNRQIKLLSFILITIFIIGIISTLFYFSIQRIIDLFFWGSLVYLLIYLFIYFNNRNMGMNKENNKVVSECNSYRESMTVFRKKVKKIILWPLVMVISAFLFEVFFEKQLIVGASDDLNIVGGAFKSLFFNTNDQAAICMSFSSIIAFFFILEQEKNKYIILNWLLLSFLGVIIIISASRATLLSFVIMIMLLIFLSIRILFFKIIYCFLIGAGGIVLLYTDWLRKFLDLLSNKITWLGLNRSIERISLAIFNFDNDNSIGYRTEIYNVFFENFKLIWLGYGPRDYIYFFNKTPLTHELGYTNPHSLFIDVYLAFGLPAFFLFLFFIFYIIWCVLVNNKLYFSQKLFSFFIVLNFCWLVWVPSSVFRLPLIWLPIFLVLIFSLISRKLA